MPRVVGVFLGSKSISRRPGRRYALVEGASTGSKRARWLPCVSRARRSECASPLLPCGAVVLGLEENPEVLPRGPVPGCRSSWLTPLRSLVEHVGASRHLPVQHQHRDVLMLDGSRVLIDPYRTPERRLVAFGPGRGFVERPRSGVSAPRVSLRCAVTGCDRFSVACRGRSALLSGPPARSRRLRL